MRKIMKTEGAVRRMGYGSCLLLLLVLFSCTSIDETLPECRLYVRFRYDYNMEFSDAFASQVNRVDVFVFDKDGTFIMKKSEQGKTLGSGSYRMLQRAFGAVRRGVDALVGLLGADRILQQLAQHAERERGLGGGAGLGDDVDREALALRQLDDVVQGRGADGVAAEINLQAVVSLIVVQALDGLDHSACAQIRTADTGDEQHIGIRADLLRSLLDAGKLFLVISNRQVQPAQKIIAGTRFGFQHTTIIPDKFYGKTIPIVLF